jgi:hypothetical protein
LKVGFREKRILLSVSQNGDIRTTWSELTYYTEVVEPQLILVPIGFETDLGSIPRIFQSFIPKDGIAIFAYILHDYLYKTGLFTRAQTDRILDEAMKSLGASLVHRKAVLNGLRVGGWVAWNKHRKADK